LKRIENYFKDKQSSKSLNNTDTKIFEPYVGPRPFDRNDKDEKRFFGRDYEADEIVSLILGHRLVLVYAQSGAGKTSIINAKISPMLEESGFQVLPSARIGNISNSENYPSSKMAINSSNIKNAYMFSALQSLLPKDVDPQSLLDKQQLTEFLMSYYPLIRIDKETGEVKNLFIDQLTDEEKNQLNHQQTYEVKNQLLVFDQSEELFTFYPNDKWREQQKDFFQQITKALKDNNFLRIVIVIREDYLAELDPFLELLPERLRPRFRLERLQKDSALSAIKSPLKYVPKDIIENYKGDIDKDIITIVHELLKIQIEYFPGKIRQIEGEFIEPIQLQVVLMRWWGKIIDVNNKSVKQNLVYVADVDTALEEFYEDAINEVINKGNIKESYIRKWCEENLITQTGTRSIVYKGLDTTVGLKNNLIKILENKYLIKENIRAGSRWCELTHDRLIKPIMSSNQKWKKEQQKRQKLKIVKISIPMIISIIGIYLFLETLYLVPPVESFSAGELPFILSVDQNSGLVYVTNPKSDTISVINGKRNDLIKQINVPNEPTDIAIDPKNNLIYTSHRDKTISVIQKDNLMNVLNPFIKQIPILESIVAYKQIRSIQLEAFSLGIDSDHSKLYVTSPPNIVYIVDTNTGKILNETKVGKIPIDVYVDSKLNKVYVANQEDNTVSVINGTNYDILENITIGKSPSSMVFNPNDNKIYVANKGDNTVSVINGTNYDIIQTLSVGKSPSSMVFNPNDNKIYVANKGDNTVSVINGSLDIVVATFEVGNNPTSLNINIDQNILYVVNNLDHKLTAIDMGNNLMNHPLMSHPLMKNIVNLVMNQHPSELEKNKIPVGGHPSGISLDYDINNDNPMLYVANTDSDTVSVIDGTNKEIIEQFKVGHKPRDIDIHSKNGTVYVSNSMSNTVSVIDRENKLIKNIPTKGNYPTGLAVDEETNLVYVANTDSDTVAVIDGKTNEVKSIPVGNGPTGIAVDSNNNLVYVTNYKDDTISVINATNQANYGDINISRHYLGNGPTAITVDLQNNKTYVLNMFSDNISIIDTDVIVDSIENTKMIDPSMKYVTIVIPAGETPSDILLDKGEIYVTNRNHNISNILDVPVFNK
jgi:YVTN family beta-propeller protein